MVKLYLCFTEHHDMKAHGGWRCETMHPEPRHYTEDGVVSYADHFSSGETSADTNRTGRWVGPRGDLDALERRNISCAFRRSNHDASIVQLVAQWL
jgi:hypothetical protein